MLKPALPLSLLLLLGLADAGPARAAHPLLVDDAGALEPGHRELELSTSGFALRHPSRPQAGLAGRLGLAHQTDAGLALTWVRDRPEDLYEGVLDLKWAPGHARGWRPRPFVRPDFALAVGPEQARLSVAGLGAGLSWQGPAGLVTCEFSWAEPLDSAFLSWSVWGAGLGVDLPVSRRWRLAAGWRRTSLAPSGDGLARFGVVRGFDTGDLSVGLQVGPDADAATHVDLLLGWTALFE